jgi:alpha-L-rhamnosidase
MSVSIAGVSFEHHYPIALAIGEPNPRISWRFEGDARNWEQSGYDIEVTRADGVPETFNFNSSSSSVLVPWPTVNLTSAESALVRVRAKGSGSHTKWSDTATVETGLLTDKHWGQAAMITTTTVSTTQTRKPFLLLKQFSGLAKPSNQLGFTSLRTACMKLQSTAKGSVALFLHLVSNHTTAVSCTTRTMLPP